MPEAAINAFLDQHNAQPKPFRWIKPADAYWLASSDFHLQHFIDMIRLT
jgi:hypothetical protein